MRDYASIMQNVDVWGIPRGCPGDARGMPGGMPGE
jgi:hypothetical protein